MFKISKHRNDFEMKMQYVL